jgi:hypothetical protein
MKPPPSPADLLRRSRLAAGVALICLLAAAETVVAHHARPNDLSVWVWAVLGSAGTVALGATLWFRQRWKHARQALQTDAVRAARRAGEPAGTAPP